MTSAEEFDADAFMNETYEEETSTQYIQLPEGDYPAIIEKVEAPRAFQGTKDPSKTYYSMNVVYAISGQPVNAELGQDTLRVRQGLFLDLKNGRLDFSQGKNVALGKLRKALNQNTNEAWNPSKMEGQGPVMITVKHRTDKNGDPQAEVSKVGTVD